MCFSRLPCCQGYSLLATWVTWPMGIYTQMNMNRVYSTLWGRRKKKSGKDWNRGGWLENAVYKAHLLFWALQRAFLYISLVQNPKYLEPGEKKGWKNLMEHYLPPSCCWNCYSNCWKKTKRKLMLMFPPASSNNWSSAISIQWYFKKRTQDTFLKILLAL